MVMCSYLVLELATGSDRRVLLCDEFPSGSGSVAPSTPVQVT